MAGNDRASIYGRALFEIVRAEGEQADVEDELFRFGRAFETNDELRTTLTDAALPAPRRQQIVEELLGGRASKTTMGIVSLVVATGRAHDLPAIIRSLVELSASTKSRVLAEVRSALELSDDQLVRLAAALKNATGKDVEVKVIIDPSVLGGLLTQIGDTVIDGTVRTKLARLRESFS